MQMKSLLFLLIASYPGIILQISAKYFIELRSETGDIFLYGCISTPRFQEDAPLYRVMCTPVTTTRESRNVYATHNFFVLWNAISTRTRILFTDNRTGTLTLWNLGYSLETKDQPYFDAVSRESWGYYRSRVRDMGVHVQPSQKNTMEAFMAQQDVRVLSKPNNQAYTRGLFRTFTAVLRGMITSYSNGFADRHAFNLFTVAMKIALQKMIDPCAVIIDDPNLEDVRNPFCATFCDFLYLGVRLFGRSSSCCSGLGDGYCNANQCTCYRNYYVVGRVWRPTVAMHWCNNDVRINV